MNRICAAFDDIGNINMNFAGIPPFNYQMLLSEPCNERNPELVQTFFDLDGMSLSTEIALAEIPPHERSSAGMYALLAEIIKETLEEEFGPLEKCYPVIVKALFAGDNWKKSSHKRMFWRVFGDIATQKLESNLKNCTVCSQCEMKIPNWVKTHSCAKNSQGFFACVDCGRQCVRLGSRQCRCDECQKTHRDEVKRLYMEKSRRKKECEERLKKRKGRPKTCSTSSQSSLTRISETEHSGQPMFFAEAGQQMKKDRDGE